MKANTLKGVSVEIKRLHTHVEQEFSVLRGPMDRVFDSMRDRAARGLDVCGKSLARRLCRVGRETNIHITARQNSKVVDSTLIGKFYYPDLTGLCHEPDEDEYPRVDIMLWFNPLSTLISPRLMVWDYLQYRLYKMLHHELVHRAQFTIGTDRSDAMVFQPHNSVSDFSKECQEYLGEIDEIEAYARDVVEEWYYIHPTTPLTMDALTDDFTTNHELSTTHYYNLVFKGDVNHLAVKRFFTKAMLWNELVVPLATTYKSAPTYLRNHRGRLGSSFVHE